MCARSAVPHGAIHGTRIGPNGREGFAREGYAVMTGTVRGRYRIGAQLRLHIQTAETWSFQADVAPDCQVAVGDPITFGFDTKHIRT